MKEVGKLLNSTPLVLVIVLNIPKLGPRGLSCLIAWLGSCVSPYLASNNLEIEHQESLVGQELSVDGV